MENGKSKVLLLITFNIDTIKFLGNNLTKSRKSDKFTRIVTKKEKEKEKEFYLKIKQDLKNFMFDLLVEYKNNREIIQIKGKP